MGKKSSLRGYRFVNVYGSLKDKTFRIVTMGIITHKMLNSFSMLSKKKSHFPIF
jgi:aspartate aminotransferase-like enzyme